MSTLPKSSLLNLRISETAPSAGSHATGSHAYDAFAAAMLDAADEFTPEAAKDTRTLGRTLPQKAVESSPASRKREEKLAAAERKLEIARRKLEAEQEKLEQKAAAKREEEELALERKLEKERLIAERKAEKALRPSGFSRAFSWLWGKRVLPEKKLRVTESISLGEKRFVAILHVEGRKFLIGGGSTGVSLLSALDPAKTSTDAAEAIHLLAVAGDRS